MHHGCKGNGILNTNPLRSGATHSNDLEREVYSSGSTREVIYSALLSHDETRMLMLLPVLDASLKGTHKQIGYSPENSKDSGMFKK